MTDKPKYIRSIIKATNAAQARLHKAQTLIDEAIGYIETAFLLHDETLVKQVREMKKADKGRRRK